MYHGIRQASTRSRKLGPNLTVPMMPKTPAPSVPIAAAARPTYSSVLARVETNSRYAPYKAANVEIQASQEILRFSDMTTRQTGKESAGPVVDAQEKRKWRRGCGRCAL